MKLSVSSCLLSGQLFLVTYSVLISGLISPNVEASEISPVADENKNLETIVITASRIPVHLDKTGSSITVINRDDIQRRSTLTVAELLREVPGLSVSESGPYGAMTQIRARGAEANQLLVLIDGIEANDPAQGSEFNFAHVSTSDIERIEIVRGPQSALWGSDAVAGVIHIITRRNFDKDSATLNIRAGSFDTSSVSASYILGNKEQYIVVKAEFLDSAGTNISRSGSEQDGYDNQTFGFNSGIQLNEAIDIGLDVRYTKAENEFDETDFLTGIPGDSNHITETELLYSQIKIKADQLEGRLAHNFITALTTTDSSTIAGALTPDQFKAQKTRYAYQLSLTPTDSPDTLSLIVEREKTEYQQRGFASFWGDPNQNRSMISDSLAAEYLAEFNDLTLSISLRQESNDDYDNARPWRITASYPFSTDTRIHASIGESIKNPTFTERFGYFTNFLGNPDLEPEESTGWEIGIDQRFLNNRILLSAVYFKAELDNEINGFWFDPVMMNFTATNMDGKSRRQGAEISVGLNLTENIETAVSYTYTDSTEDVSGRQIDELRRPRHMASLNINYIAGQFSNLNLSVQYNGSQEDIFFPPWPQPSERVRLGDYTLLNMSYQYQLTNTIELTVGGRNLLDEEYEQVFGFQSPGRAIYAGIEMKW